MTEPIRAIMVGAGQRGSEVFGRYALQHPEQLSFVAVAEPVRVLREQFARQHAIPVESQYESWEPLLALPQMARAAFICTQDTQHTAPALAAMQAGYDLLLEKPMATTPEECRALVQASEQTGRQLHIAHSLRYTRHFQTMRKILKSGMLGQISHVSHAENVAFWHMAHSYVRGPWNNKARSSPMILAKCCHDFDILLWLLDETAVHLSSAGNLLHFRPENAPPEAPAYCLDGCPVAESCPYYAPHLYIDMIPFWRSFALSASGFPRLAFELQLRSPAAIRLLAPVYPPLQLLSNYKDKPRSSVVFDPTPEKLLQALRSSPYGRCVYHCDNDVVDHQVVSMLFESGKTVTLTMQGHSHEEHRATRIEGSHGTLTAHFGMGGAWIKVVEHRSRRETHTNTSGAVDQDHGGGDSELTAGFIHALHSGGHEALTTARQALESHLMAFAAEAARLEHRVIFREEYVI